MGEVCFATSAEEEVTIEKLSLSINPLFFSNEDHHER